MKKLFLFLSIIFFSNAVYVDYAMNGQLLNNEARQIIQNIEQGCASLKREKAENKQKNKQKINQLKEQVQQLTQQLEEKNNENAKHLYTINLLHTRLTSMKGTLQLMKDELTSITNQKASINNKLEQYKQLISKLLEEATNKIKDQNQKLQQSLQNLTKENNELKNKHIELNQNNEMKDARIAELEEQLQLLRQEFNVQLQQCTTLQQINQTQQTEMNQIKIQLQTLQQKFQELQQQITQQENAQQNQDGQIQQLQNENEQKDNQIQQLKQEKDQLEQNKRDLLDKIQQLLTDQQHTKDISKVNTVVIKDQINKMINNNAKSAVILKIRINSQELIDINYFITANNLMIILIPNAISSQTNLEPAIYNLSTSLDNVAHADAFMSELMRICSTPSDMQITTDVSSPGVAA